MNLFSKSIAFASLTAGALCAAPGLTIQGTDFLYNGNKIFFSGTNLAWADYNSDVGDSPLNENAWRKAVEGTRAAGGNAIRWWLFNNMSQSPAINETTHLVSGLKENTINKPIVMGMKTLESLPHLLPKRTHIVLTRQNKKLDNGIIIVHSVDELLDYIKRYDDEVMIIGGASVYKEMLEYSDKLISTEIDATHDADVYFPSFNKEEWDSKVVGEQEENNIKYKHLVYTRKNNKNN